MGRALCWLVVATALLGRLLHHAIVIQIEGASYRLCQLTDLIPEVMRPTRTPYRPASCTPPRLSAEAPPSATTNLNPALCLTRRVRSNVGTSLVPTPPGHGGTRGSDRNLNEVGPYSVGILGEFSIDWKSQSALTGTTKLRTIQNEALTCGSV